MREFIAEGRTLPEAYHESLRLLQQYGPVTPCPDYNTTQKEVSMTLFVAEPLAEPRISRLFIGGYRELEQYCLEMLDGVLDFEVEKGNWKYTYHNRMVAWDSGKGEKLDQIAFVIRELKRNPSSRRAVIDVRRNPDDMDSDDPACLQHIQYFIRDGALHCKLLFRSNDACKAAFMNAYALICLQKRIADALGVKMGTYTHRANSYHCYERDFAMLDGYVKRLDEAEDEDDVTFSYEDGWQELMQSARPEILRDVEKLKNQK